MTILSVMDYTQFAGLKVRIKTKDNELYEGFVWGFRFNNEIDENILEVWMDDKVFDVEDIVSIEECKESPPVYGLTGEDLSLN